MAQKIEVPAVVTEKTYVGKVSFPATTPERLYDLLEFPQDLFKLADKLGLDERAIRLLLAMLQGKWALSVVVNTQRWAVQTGLQYADMDEIVRDLVAKNYAQLGERLELYRLWICLLHIKGIRFIRA